MENIDRDAMPLRENEVTRSDRAVIRPTRLDISHSVMGGDREINSIQLYKLITEGDLPVGFQHMFVDEEHEIESLQTSVR